MKQLFYVSLGLTTQNPFETWKKQKEQRLPNDKLFKFIVTNTSSAHYNPLGSVTSLNIPNEVHLHSASPKWKELWTIFINSLNGCFSDIWKFCCYQWNGGLASEWLLFNVPSLLIEYHQKKFQQWHCQHVFQEFELLSFHSFHLEIIVGGSILSVFLRVGGLMLDWTHTITFSRID